MPLYPPPEENPRCECVGNPVRAFFCRQGHMLECHAGFDCAEAGCSHLRKYDFSPEEVDQLEQLAIKRLRAGQLGPYGLDAVGQVVVKPKQ